MDARLEPKGTILVGLAGYAAAFAILGLIPLSRPERIAGYVVFALVFLGLGGVVAYHMEQVRDAMRERILAAGGSVPLSYYTSWYALSVDVGDDLALQRHQRRARNLTILATVGFVAIAALDVFILAPSLYSR